MMDMDVERYVHEEQWMIKIENMFANNQEAYNKLDKIAISYNASQGLVNDIFESLQQVMNNEWGWIEFSDYFRTYLELKGYQTSFDEQIPDLSGQIEAYKQSIKDEHGVIVIAHSQGNYYTNEAYETLDEWMKDYFHMFGVATPANHVAGYDVDDTTAPYVKFHNDAIKVVVTGLASNRDDPNPEHNSVISYDAHDFYNSYMTAENTKSDIFNFILNKIQEHGDAPSQWETDQEFNKDTIDYKITVKHRYDPTLVMSEEVYPFAPSQKLYRVIDNTGGNGWVKATCGGTNISSSWIDQKENEFYMINNPEKELLSGDQKNYFLLQIDIFAGGPYPSLYLFSNNNYSYIKKLFIPRLPYTTSTKSTATFVLSGLFKDYRKLAGAYTHGRKDYFSPTTYSSKGILLIEGYIELDNGNITCLSTSNYVPVQGYSYGRRNFYYI